MSRRNPPQGRAASGKRQASKPAFERTRTWIPLSAIALAAIFLVAVIQVANPPPQPYSVVRGEVPSDSRELPDIPVNETWFHRIAFWGSTQYGPSYTDYQNFSLSHWSMGLHVQGTFWLPILYPAYTNLTDGSLHTDPSGRYILVPYDAYLGVHDGYFYHYVIAHGVHWGLYDDMPSQPNHSDPYLLCLLIEEQQYQLRWIEQTQQYDPQEPMLYPPNDLYSPTLPEAPENTDLTQGWVPVVIDGEGVYANVFFTGHPIPLNGFGGPWTPPMTMAPVYLYTVIRSDSTIFVSGMPFYDLPHTSQYVFFALMFSLVFDPPIHLTTGNQTYDYDPPSGYSPADTWSDFGAYLRLYAPLG